MNADGARSSRFVRSTSAFVRSDHLQHLLDTEFEQPLLGYSQRRGSVEPSSASIMTQMNSRKYNPTVTPCKTSFMVLTHKLLPKSLAAEIGMKFSFGLMIEPAATITDIFVNASYELSMPLPKCSSCGAYVNGHNRFTNSKDSFFCCICGEMTHCSPQYAALLRNFNFPRPELSAEGYNYFSTTMNEYQGLEIADCNTTPAGHVCYYMVELTAHAVHTKKAIGALTAILRHIEYLIGIYNSYNYPLYIGMLFFNTHVHILTRTPRHTPNMPTIQSISICTLMDEDVLPSPDGFFFTVANTAECNAIYSFVRNMLSALQTKQPLSFGPQPHAPRQIAMQHSLKTLLQILQRKGGRAILFLCTQPTTVDLSPIQADPLSTRSEIQQPLLAAKKVYSCTSPFYGDTAIHFVRCNMSMSIVLMPSKAAIGFNNILEIVRRTNGGIWYVETFSLGTSVAPIQRFLEREFGEATCFHVQCRTHFPRQISIRNFLGNITRRSDSVIHAPAATRATSFGVRLQVHGEIDSTFVYYQVRVSFLTITGQRLVKVCTKAVELSADTLQLAASINPHALINLYVKMVAHTMRWSPKLSHNQVLMLNKKTDLAFIVTSVLSDSLDPEVATKTVRRNLREFLLLCHSMLPDVVLYKGTNVLKYDIVKDLNFLGLYHHLEVLPELVFSMLKTDMLDLSTVDAASLPRRLVSITTLESITTFDLIGYLYPRLYYVDVENSAAANSIDLKDMQVPLHASSLARQGAYILRHFYCLYVFINVQQDTHLYSQLVDPKDIKRAKSTCVPDNTPEKYLIEPVTEEPGSPTFDNIVWTKSEHEGIISQLERNKSMVRSLKRSSFFGKPLASTRLQRTIQERVSEQCSSVYGFLTRPSSVLQSSFDDPRHPYTNVQIGVPRSLSVGIPPTKERVQTQEREQKPLYPQETLHLRTDTAVANNLAAAIEKIQKRVQESRGMRLNVTVFSGHGPYAEVMHEWMLLDETDRGISIKSFRQSIEHFILHTYDLLDD